LIGKSQTVTFWHLRIEDDNSHNANQSSLPEGRNITANQRSLPAVQRKQQHGGEVIAAVCGLPELAVFNGV
jgi:hypothetical protein